jgi:hypothetical protein
VAADRVRDEAERLVAAAITAVSLAARGMGAAGRGAAGFGSSGHGPTISNGSPECCVCPVCRVIAAMRDPGSDLADRLAAGAGDLATGVTWVLRALSRPAGPEVHDEKERDGDEFWESLRRRAADEATSWRAGGVSEEDADPWRAATSTPTTSSAAGPATKPMAKKVAKKAVKKAAPAESEPSASSAEAPPMTRDTATTNEILAADRALAAQAVAPVKKATKKTVAKETAAKETAAKETAAKETAAKETAAKKTVAKKTAKKAPPPQEFG